MGKQGFTLAEVLITLAIIGVVAAMTIPALLLSTESLEMKTAYKKSVSILNQAIIMGIAKGGKNPSNCPSCNEAGTDGQNALATYFKTYVNAAQSDDNYFYTVDGLRYTFLKANSGSTENCGAVDSAIGEFDSATTSCYVWVDVNGDKGANTPSTGNETTGANAYVYNDQFYAVVTSGSVIPASNETNDASRAALYD